MSVNVVAKRYAEALFQIGKEEESLNTLREEFTQVKDIFTSNEDLTTYLNHPGVSARDKASFIDKVFHQFEKTVKNTLKLLVERQRINLTASIIDNFIEIVHDAEGTAEVTVQSVRELSEGEKKDLKEGLAKRFNKKTILLTNLVNPEVLGGLHIRIGNTIIDGTVANKLHRMERRIISANNQ